jgi:DNA invertase Pin-like site-specific DNA recombinase
MKECIEYLRKSQFDRDFADLSIEETLAKHEQSLNEFIEKTDYTVTEVLKEVVSGETLAQRPQMMLLLDKINSGNYYGVICKDIDRLSRGNSLDSGYIMQVLKINNCKIITPEKVYDLNDDQDEQFTDLKFLFSRFELSTIKKRLNAGRIGAVKQGLWVGSHAPYGYERYKLVGEKGYSLKPIPAQAEIVRLIYDMYVNQHLGYVSIAEKLKDIDKSRTWTKVGVAGVINNPVYAGYVRYGYAKYEKVISDGKIITVKKHNDPDKTPRYKGRHEAIISKELYDKATAIRQNRIHPSVKVHRPLHDPLAGILFCAKCGKAIRVHRPAKDRKNQRERYDCVNTSCDCRSSYSDDIESAILNELRKWLKGYTVTVKAPADDITNYQFLLDNARNELTALETKQNKLCELLESGVYTTALFQQRNAILTQQIDETIECITELEKRLETQNKRVSERSQIVPTVKHILDDYDKLDTETKNKLLKQVLHRVTYYRQRGTDDVQIKIYPVLSSCK